MPTTYLTKDDNALLRKLKGYKGNMLLKRANQKIEWTPELIKEYIRCSKDVVYFTEKYMKIITEKGLQPFELYNYQRRMLKNFSDNKFNIVTTARQAGKSTTACAFILWYVLFHTEKTVALLANKGDTAKEILYKVQMGYQHLPKWLQQGTIEWNKTSFALENNSRVIAAPTSSDSIRGYSIDLLFIDEAAHIEGWDEFYTSTYPTIASRESSKVILVSTPLGLNHFYSFWKNAIDNKNGYKWQKVIWSDVPGRGERWKKETLKGMNFDHEKFDQEQNCEYLGSSGSLIAGWKLKELVPQTSLFEKDGVNLYEKPKENNNYVILVDVSRGKGLDYSAFQVINVSKMPYNQVCTYRSNLITPADYAEIVYKFAKNYNNASVLVEINDIGEQVSNTIHYDFGYDNVLFTYNNGRAGKQISTGFGNQGKADKGIRTTTPVKATGCALLKLLIEGNQLIINDFETIQELATFSKKGNTYTAEAGKHDDLVMCLVLFAWLSDQQYFKEYTSINTLMILREKTEEDIDNDISAFGFVSSGREHQGYNDEVLPRNWVFIEEDNLVNGNKLPYL